MLSHDWTKSVSGLTLPVADHDDLQSCISSGQVLIVCILILSLLSIKSHRDTTPLEEILFGAKSPFVFTAEPVDWTALKERDAETELLNDA